MRRQAVLKRVLKARIHARHPAQTQPSNAKQKGYKEPKSNSQFEAEPMDLSHTSLGQPQLTREFTADEGEDRLASKRVFRKGYVH
jgi:hypothetical protein